MRNAHHVFWLSGLAGTGKSTIARTMASHCTDVQQLGASFFFARDGGDLASANKFVTTVAAQPAAVQPVLKPYIARAVRIIGNPFATALHEQWLRLVLQPLADVNGGLQRLYPLKPVLVVVDALDECYGERDTAAILRLLALGALVQHSQWLRVLLTSRLETPIRYGIQSISQASLARLILHDIDPPIVTHDISVYLADNLCRVGADFLRDADWPGAKTVEELVTRAGGLYIWAATAVQYISDGGEFAKDRLQDVLCEVNNALTPQKS